MNWVNEWAKLEVIGKYIALGLLGLVLAIVIIYGLYKWISDVYKSHSKKYEYNCLLDRYERKKSNENDK